MCLRLYLSSRQQPGRGSQQHPQNGTFVRSCWECIRCAFLTSVPMAALRESWLL